MTSPLDDRITKLREVLEGRPEIRFALLYGSAAEGLPFRDLDVAVFVERDRVPASEDLAYATRLAADLAAVPEPVDLRLLNEGPLPFRYNVSRGRPLTARDPEALADFRAHTWTTFLDFKPVALAYLDELA